MGPDIKGKNVYGKFLIPSHKLASLRSASKNDDDHLQHYFRSGRIFLHLVCFTGIELLSLVSIKSQSVAKCRRVSQNFGSATLCDEWKLLY